MNTNHIIVAPHADDEIIGCYEILEKYKGRCHVFFPTQIGFSQSLYASQMLGYEAHRMEEWKDWEHIAYKFYFPDHIYELHPEHRKWGAFGEELARNGFDVSFYVTNMLAPYIREVKDFKAKRNALNECYSMKQSLWEHDFKYFLFEGQCKWIF